MFAVKAKVEVPLKWPLGFFFPNVFSYCLDFLFVSSSSKRNYYVLVGSPLCPAVKCSHVPLTIGKLSPLFNSPVL